MAPERLLPPLDDLDADFLLADLVPLRAAFFAPPLVDFVLRADFVPPLADVLRPAVFLAAAFFAPLRAVLLLPPAADLELFFFGTFSPLSLASDKPIAIACLRLVTFLPLRPLFN